MKTIIATIFIIFISFTAQAQKTTNEVKVETVEMSIVTETTNEVKANTTTEIARLYKFKNSRIKRDLNFLTKANKPKMA
ncbi:hypothetical protein DFQ03_1506 [Maribacter caenipelagi]|uniref:Uncharacterized protein n=1 Tax=Maribacter caenipelagi TaxID=1447781 RepID=A0A4R7DCZ0_9FLAO|nr:hypothetical protein [Maribacter caenipelagi]TDS17016.1 hypothetical protein DFQ03_1506 [Maribacter caenipelagi]